MSGNVGLDLSSSRAKVARARHHLESLKEEIGRVLQEHNPYSIGPAKIHPKTGWVDLYITLSDLAENHLGVFVGDVIHNLRCALDHITAQLATANGVVLRIQQFPIYDTRKAYEWSIGIPGKPGNKAKTVEGIGDEALKEIERLQPYHRDEQGGNARHDPLWIIHHFSNNDKHREIVAEVFKCEGANLKLTYSGGPVLETWEDPNPRAPIPGQEHELCRVRIAEPFPSKLDPKGSTINIVVLFAASPRGDDIKSLAITCEVLDQCCDHVGMIIDLFETL